MDCVLCFVTVQSGILAQYYICSFLEYIYIVLDDGFDDLVIQMLTVLKCLIRDIVIS